MAADEGGASPRVAKPVTAMMLLKTIAARRLRLATNSSDVPIQINPTVAASAGVFQGDG